MDTGMSARRSWKSEGLDQLDDFFHGVAMIVVCSAVRGCTCSSWSTRKTQSFFPVTRTFAPASVRVWAERSPATAAEPARPHRHQSALHKVPLPRSPPLSLSLLSPFLSPSLSLSLSFSLSLLSLSLPFSPPHSLIPLSLSLAPSLPPSFSCSLSPSFPSRVRTSSAAGVFGVIEVSGASGVRQVSRDVRGCPGRPRLSGASVAFGARQGAPGCPGCVRSGGSLFATQNGVPSHAKLNEVLGTA